ncbi:diguanylate cyclase [Shewanella sp. VB17]|nr:diguanylate cyclase [Shewanella sp. VB17]
MHKINLQHVKLSVIFGLIGLLVNLYPIQLFANSQLILGNIFFVITAILLGPWFALLCAIISSIGLMIAWASPHILLLFSLEAIWLGYARKKDIYSLYADISYWFFLGMPLFYLYSTHLSDLPTSHIFFITLKQGINGLIYVSLASLAVIIFSGLWHLEGKIKDKKRRTFNAQLTYNFILVLTLSLLCSALVFNHQIMLQQQTNLNQKLHNSAIHLGHATEAFIDTHKKAIATASRWLSLSSRDLQGMQSKLIKLHHSYTDFGSMIVTDAEARVIAAAPITILNLDKLNSKSLTVKNPHYFQQAFNKQETYVSPPFRGKGDLGAPTVSISAPIYHKEGAEEPVGVIEGFINLASFVNIERADQTDNLQSMIIMDDNNRIIYASDKLTLPALSIFKSVKKGQGYNTSLHLFNLYDFENSTPEFVYSRYQLNNGWKLYIVAPFSPLLRLLETQYLTTLTALLFSLLITIIVAQVISMRLTHPLNIISNKFAGKGTSNVDSYHIDEESPQEFLTLYQSIKMSKQELIRYQLALEEKVATRTFALEKANKKLQLLAEHDDLTNLYNRRSAEIKFNTTHHLCLRSGEMMVVAIIDIDHFKTINDTFGHLAGDECLRAIANNMKLFFKRDSDVIARYGGEEFLIILPMAQLEKIEQHLNKFRVQIKKGIMLSTQEKTEIIMTVSIGAVVANPNYSKSLQEWFKQADKNLYQAKNQGRDNVVVSHLA